MCFVLGEIFLDTKTEIQLWLSSKTLQKTAGFVICIPKINNCSFTITIKGITLCITCLNAMYYDSVVIKEISVCNLLNHNTGHLAYVITYPVCNIKFSALSEFA